MTRTPAPTRKRNRLQQQVLHRMERGLAPTHWQQLLMHLISAWRQRRKISFQRVAFHLGGMMRVLWKPVGLFHVSGIPIQIHLSCLLYPGCLLVLIDWTDVPARSALLVTMVVLFVGSGLLVHELAHAIAARRFGIHSSRIVVVPFGAFLELETIPSARAELVITAAGPLTSLSLAGGFWLLLATVEMIHARWTYLPRIFCQFGYVLNLTLALFNLLPCFPMDGGRILRSLLAVAVGRLSRMDFTRARLLATRIAVRYVAWLVALAMIVLTITVTHVWFHLLVFPLLVVVAELEYWMLRTENIPSRDHQTFVNNRDSKVHEQ